MFYVSQAPQTIYESPTARVVHGTSRVVWGRLDYIKVGVLVGHATAVVQTQRIRRVRKEVHKKINYSGYQLYCC